MDRSGGPPDRRRARPPRGACTPPARARARPGGALRRPAAGAAGRDAWRGVARRLLRAVDPAKDSATPRGTTSTAQVAISIRCDAEELIETRPCCPSGRESTTSRSASWLATGATAAPSAAASASAVASAPPLASPTATTRLTPASASLLSETGRRDRDGGGAALEQALGGVADGDVALGRVRVRAEHDRVGALAPRRAPAGPRGWSGR